MAGQAPMIKLTAARQAGKRKDENGFMPESIGFIGGLPCPKWQAASGPVHSAVKCRRVGRSRLYRIYCGVIGPDCSIDHFEAVATIVAEALPGNIKNFKIPIGPEDHACYTAARDVSAMHSHWIAPGYIIGGWSHDDACADCSSGRYRGTAWLARNGELDGQDDVGAKWIPGSRSQYRRSQCRLHQGRNSRLQPLRRPLLPTRRRHLPMSFPHRPQLHLLPPFLLVLPPRLALLQIPVPHRLRRWSRNPRWVPAMTPKNRPSRSWSGTRRRPKRISTP